MRPLPPALATLILAASAAAQANPEFIEPPANIFTRWSDIALSRDGATLFRGDTYQNRQSFLSGLSVRPAGSGSFQPITASASASVWLQSVSGNGLAAGIGIGGFASEVWRSPATFGPDFGGPTIRCMNEDGTAFGLSALFAGSVEGDPAVPARAVVLGVTTAFPDPGATSVMCVDRSGSLFGGSSEGRPYLWHPGSAPEYLPSPPGEARCGVLRITPDPDTAILMATQSTAHRITLYRWTRGGPTTELVTYVSPSTDAIWAAVDDTGSTAIFRDVYGAASIWTPPAGLASPQDFFAARGLSLADYGMSSPSAWSLSGDGTALAGMARGPGGRDWLWVVRGVHPPCAADFNRDGFVDFFDYSDYVGCFETGLCGVGSGDMNGDGFVDFFDYDAFVSAFEVGC